MKKLLFPFLLASACLIAQPPDGGRRGPMGFGPGPGGPGGPRFNRTVTGAPYSAVEVTTEQQTLAGGNVIQHQTSTTITRDGQGRVRMESEFTHPGPSGTVTEKRITISDPVAGYVHEIDPQAKTVSSHAIRPAPTTTSTTRTRPAGAGPRALAAGQANPNVKTEDLGAQSMNGVLASGTRVTHTIAAGTVGNALPITSVRETWMSSDLQVPVMTKTVDPRFGTRITQLTNINRGEPDATLFQVPTGYTVRQGRGPGGRGPRPPAGGGIQ